MEDVATGGSIATSETEGSSCVGADGVAASCATTGGTAGPERPTVTADGVGTRGSEASLGLILLSMMRANKEAPLCFKAR